MGSRPLRAKPAGDAPVQSPAREHRSEERVERRAAGLGLGAGTRTPAGFFQLQRTAGNRATCGVLDRDAAIGPVLQRTVWRWDGTSWVVEKSSTADTDTHPHPSVAVPNPKVNDRYDQQTGTRTSQTEHLRGRLERAKDRDSKRTSPVKRAHLHSGKDFSEVSKKRGNRLAFATPTGTMSFGRGMFNTQPYGTFDPELWNEAGPGDKKKGKKRKRGLNYDEMAQEMDTLPPAKKKRVVAEMRQFADSVDAPSSSGASLSTEQQKAAAGISALLAVAEPHGTRNPFGGKPERAALKTAEQKGFKFTFNRARGAYPPAWAKGAGAPVGGTSAFAEMATGDRDMPPATRDLLEEMSASSEESETEADDVGTVDVKSGTMSDEDDELDVKSGEVSDDESESEVKSGTMSDEDDEPDVKSGEVSDDESESESDVSSAMVTDDDEKSSGS
jgi:hypothetical protein